MDQAATPVSRSTSAGIPNPTAATSGAALRISSTASDEDVEGLLQVRATPGSVHSVVDHEILVDHASEQLRSPGIDADHPGRRHGRTIYRGT